MAARLNTSVGALVKEYLAGLTRAAQQPPSGPGSESEEARDQREREELVRLFDSIPCELGFRPTRDLIYDRPGLSGQ